MRYPVARRGNKKQRFVTANTTSRTHPLACERTRQTYDVRGLSMVFCTRVSPARRPSESTEYSYRDEIDVQPPCRPHLEVTIVSRLTKSRHVKKIAPRPPPPRHHTPRRRDSPVYSARSQRDIPGFVERHSRFRRFRREAFPVSSVSSRGIPGFVGFVERHSRFRRFRRPRCSSRLRPRLPPAKLTSCSACARPRCSSCLPC